MTEQEASQRLRITQLAKREHAIARSYISIYCIAKDERAHQTAIVTREYLQVSYDRLKDFVTRIYLNNKDDINLKDNITQTIRTIEELLQDHK